MSQFSSVLFWFDKKCFCLKYAYRLFCVVCKERKKVFYFVNSIKFLSVILFHLNNNFSLSKENKKFFFAGVLILILLYLFIPHSFHYYTFLHSHFCIDYQVLFSIEAFHFCWKLSIIELQMSLNDFRILHSLQYLINVKFSKTKY